MNDRRLMSLSPYGRGFSYVEVMIALAVLALGIIPIFSIFTSTSKGTAATIEELTATNFANEIIDNLSAYKYGELPSVQARTDFDSLKNDPFFARLRVSPIKAGYKRFVRIYEKSAHFKKPAGADAEIIKQLEKICSFKVIEVSIEYAEETGGGKKSREFKMTALTGVDDIENFE